MGTHTLEKTNADTAVTQVHERSATAKILITEDASSQENEPELEQAPLMDEDAEVYDVVNEWAQGTSIHGLANVMDRCTFKRWRRLIWLSLVLTSFAFMVWQIGTLVAEYTSYDVQTDIFTVYPSSLSFPEVIVCNLNRYKVSAQTALNITEPKNLEELRLLAQPLNDLVWYTLFNDQKLDTSIAWKEVVTSLGLCIQFQTDEKIYVPGISGGRFGRSSELCRRSTTDCDSHG